MQKEKIDFYKKREEHRKEAREYLPPELQLEFPQTRPEKEKWSFEGKLFNLRKSEEPADRLFIEYLRGKIKKESERPEQEKIFREIENLAQKEKQKIIESLSILLFYQEGLRDESYNVRCATISALEELAKVLPKETLSLCQEGMRDKSSDVRCATADALGELAKVLPKEALSLCQEGMKDEDYHVRRAAAGALGELAKVFPKESLSLYQEGLRDEDFTVRYDTASALKELVKVLPKEALSLYQEGMGNEDSDVRFAIASALEELVKVFPKEALSLCQEGMKDEDYHVRRAAAGALGELAKVFPEEALSFYQEGMRDKSFDVRRATAGALKELVKVLPKEALSLYQEGMGNEDYFVRSAIASALGELAKVFPKEVFSLCQEGMGNEDSSVRSAIASALGELAKMIDVKKVNSFNQILAKKDLSPHYRLYYYQIITNLLKQKKDLAYLYQFNKEKDLIDNFSEEINSNLSEEKKTDNSEKFWQKHQAELAKLQAVDLNLTSFFINAYLKNYGFPRMEGFLSKVVRNFDEKPLVESLPKIKKIHQEYFARLIEISSAYQRMGLKEQLEKTLKENTKKEILAPDLLRVLGKELLTLFAEKMEIEAKIKEETFDRWNLEYLPRLFTAQAGYEEEDKEILKLIMKASFQEKRFLPLLFGSVEGEYTPEEKEWLDEIKRYNFKVKEEFEKNGLDFKKWLTYPEEKEFRVGAGPGQMEARKNAFEKELIENIRALLGSFKEKGEGLLSQARAKEIFNKVVKKYGIHFENDQIAHPQKGRFSTKDIGLILGEFNSLVEESFKEEKDENKKTQIGTVLDHLQELQKRIPDLEKELTKKGYSLKIGLWQREPGYDIFQGNYTHCCIAVENFNKGAMLDYLLDSGLQVVEIKDTSEARTIAQTWLWIARDSQRNLNLVLDNVEINSDYSGIRNQIRENLFDYLKKYTRSFGQGKIKRIVLGTAFNDIETDDLDKIQLALSKIAGSPRETQYLDALGSNWVDVQRETVRTLAEVEELELKEEKEPKRKAEAKIEITTEITRNLLEGVAEVEKAVFPEQMQSALDDLKKTLENKKGIQLIVRREDKVVGYLSSKPQEDAFKELKNYDHQLRPEKETLYLESVAIKPEDRGIKLALGLLEKIKKEAREKGYKKISMHARVQNNLSHILQKKGAKFLRRIENWHEFGEPFDYLEINLED